MILTLALTCCTSTPKNESMAIPTLPPDPITSDGTCIVIYDEKTDTVTLPLWYWKKIVRYMVDTQTNQK